MVIQIPSEVMQTNALEKTGYNDRIDIEGDRVSYSGPRSIQTRMKGRMNERVNERENERKPIQMMMKSCQGR